LKEKLDELRSGLAQSTEIRWLTTYHLVNSILEQNNDQIAMINNELYSYKHENRYIYREPLANVFENITILQDYVDIQEPIDRAVRIFQVSQIYGKINESNFIV
jgi:hypothetical protein